MFRSRFIIWQSHYSSSSILELLKFFWQSVPYIFPYTAGVIKIGHVESFLHGFSSIECYNPLTNFRAILLAILGHVVTNRRAGIRQYTPSVSIFALRFQWQESMTKSTKRVSFHFLSSSLQMAVIISSTFFYLYIYIQE